LSAFLWRCAVSLLGVVFSQIALLLTNAVELAGLSLAPPGCLTKLRRSFDVGVWRNFTGFFIIQLLFTQFDNLLLEKFGEPSTGDHNRASSDDTSDSNK